MYPVHAQPRIFHRFTTTRVVKCFGYAAAGAMEIASRANRPSDFNEVPCGNRNCYGDEQVLDKYSTKSNRGIVK